MKLTVITPGLLTTVQDPGRFGNQGSGVGETGAMDRRALRIGNRLVANRKEAAALEMTLSGGTFRFDEPAVCALTGADMHATLGSEKIPTYRSFYVLPGETLKLGTAEAGARAYLCVRGGIDVPVVMGSRSTDLKCKIGGLEGRKLRAGDELPVGRLIRHVNPPERQFPRPDFPREAVVRAIPGPQADAFTENGLNTFFSEVYTVSAKSDRMGLRLEGKAVESRAGTDIVSDGIVFGSVQIPANGMPIVLMADHQTTGGYAKAATVVSGDLPVLAQLRPGDTVRFRRVTMEEMQKHKWLPEKPGRRKESIK